MKIVGRSFSVKHRKVRHYQCGTLVWSLIWKTHQPLYCTKNPSLKKTTFLVRDTISNQNRKFQARYTALVHPWSKSWCILTYSVVTDTYVKSATGCSYIHLLFLLNLCISH